MRNKSVKILGCIITLALVVLGVHILGYITRPTDTDSTYERIKSFHDFPDNTLDVIVYGSSHAFTGINTLELYQKYGLAAYNYGTNWQAINTTKLFLQDSLLSQSPKLAIIDTFHAGSVLMDTNITGEIYYCRYLDAKAERFRYLQKCFGNNIERYLSYYMPLCAFHENWNTLTKQSFYNLDDPMMSSVEKIHNTLGSVPCDTVFKTAFPNYTDMLQQELIPSSVEELDEIVKICKDNNIDILFVTVPYALSYCYNEAVAIYAQERGCAYIDLFNCIDEIGLNAQQDFRDESHLNTSGATKVADFLGNYIRQHYQLPDVRQDKGDFWEQFAHNNPELIIDNSMQNFDGIRIYGKCSQIAQPTFFSPSTIEALGKNEKIEIGIAGKNLLKNSAKSTTINGVTFDKQKDGTIIVKGRAEDTFNYVIAKKQDLYVLLPYIGETMSLYGCPAHGSVSSYRLNAFGLNGEGQTVTDLGEGKQFQLCDFSESNDVFIAIRLSKGINYDLHFSPMICLSDSDKVEYDPYKERNGLFPVPDGLYGIPVKTGENYIDNIGQKYICDTIELRDKTIIKRIGHINLSEDMIFTIQYYEHYNRIGFILNDALKEEKRNPVICNRGFFSETEDKVGVVFTYSNAAWFYVPKSIDSTVKFRAWLNVNPTEFIYLLDEPMIESLSSEQVEAIDHIFEKQI